MQADTHRTAGRKDSIGSYLQESTATFYLPAEGRGEDLAMEDA